MKAKLIWSTNSLQHNIQIIRYIRDILQNEDWDIVDDWVNTISEANHSVPYFLEVQGFDYLKASIDGILESNLTIFVFTKRSSYLTTLLKYAMYKNKEIIVIYRRKQFLNCTKLNGQKIILLPVRSIASFQKNIKGIKEK